MDETADRIRKFLSAPAFAVVGASNDRSKFGALVFDCLRRKGLKTYPVNPRERSIQGEACYPSLAALPERVEAVSVITPPAVTEGVVEEAAAAGARRIWMQPGAESRAAIEKAKSLGLEVIAGGPCVLIELDYPGFGGSKPDQP